MEFLRCINCNSILECSNCYTPFEFGELKYKSTKLGEFTIYGKHKELMKIEELLQELELLKRVQ